LKGKKLTLLGDSTFKKFLIWYSEAQTGTIEPGKFADIIIVDGNPLADIKILQNVEKIKMVMLEGKVEIDRGGL